MVQGPLSLVRFLKAFSVAFMVVACWMPAWLMAEDDQKADRRVQLASGSMIRFEEPGQGASFDFAINEGDSDPEETASGEWLMAPVPGYSPVFGFTLAGALAKIYRPENADQDSPAWLSGGGFFVAENKSWGLAAGHKMNVSDDAWRLLGAATYADLIYRYYGSGNEAGDEGRSIQLNHRVLGGTVNVLREVAENWYVGLNLAAGDSRIEKVSKELPPDFEFPPEWEDENSEFTALLVSLGIEVEYDSRNNEFYPSKGVLMESKIRVSSESIGSDYDFETFLLSYNQYFSLGTNDILAIRFYGRYTEGDVPFFALSSLGQGSDLRGYTPGRYRDNALLTAQAEYRRQISNRWAAVAFFGVGGVGPSLGEVDQALPAGGVGVRFVLAEENHVVLRFDAAWGRDDESIYLSVGEAF